MDNMQIIIKKYNELTTDELYEILKLRIAVFVVEQNCPYQDIDDKDKAAVHIYMKDENGINAYLRVLPQGVSYAEASIGRVISVRRRKGLATTLMKEGISVAKEYFGADSIRIEAQVYARKLYENLGFVQVSEEFLEDGIPHIEMLLADI